MVLKPIVGAVLVAVVGFAAAWCAASKEISRLEKEELVCIECFWRGECERLGKRLCETENNEAEDAPWVKL